MGVRLDPQPSDLAHSERSTSGPVKCESRPSHTARPAPQCSSDLPPRFVPLALSTPHSSCQAAFDDRSHHGHSQMVCAHPSRPRSEEHTSELQSLTKLVCRLLLEKKKKKLSSISMTT